MKTAGLISMLLLAVLVAPRGHGARRGLALHYAQGHPHVRPRPHPPRIIRSPQRPKVVRPVPPPKPAEQAVSR